MSSQNNLSLFINPKFPARVLEWSIAAISILGTALVVAHAFVTSSDAAVRVQLVLQGCEMIVVTLAAAAAAGALYALSGALEDRTGTRTELAAA